MSCLFTNRPLDAREARHKIHLLRPLIVSIIVASGKSVCAHQDAACHLHRCDAASASVATTTMFCEGPHNAKHRTRFEACCQRAVCAHLAAQALMPRLAVHAPQL